MEVGDRVPNGLVAVVAARPRVREDVAPAQLLEVPGRWGLSLILAAPKPLPMQECGETSSCGEMNEWDGLRDAASTLGYL